MKIIGIDPGLVCTGIAVAETTWANDPTVWQARSIRVKNRDLSIRVQQIAIAAHGFGSSFFPDILVIEKPQIYQGHKQEGDPNDLINLSILVGALIAEIPAHKVLLPLPHQWKGGVGKVIHHRRIREQVPGLGRQSKDALDAVGLALYGVERFYHARS